MAGCTLVQISDVHLGRSFSGLPVSDELRRALAEESLAAVETACRLAAERGAACLLVAGDLFDRPELDPDLTPRVRSAFAAAGRPVLVTPGNHDEFGPASVWNRRTLGRLGLEPWPPNVHVFETRSLSPHPLPGADVVVYGHRVDGYHDTAGSPLSDVTLLPEGRHHVLLVHGALAGPWAGRGTAPFTAGQLAAVGADYAAVGHFHRFQRIEHEGRLVGAYAGAPVPGELSEDPHGGVLVVTLDDSGGEPRVECVQVSTGRIRRLDVDGNPPFESADDAAARIGDEAARAGAGPGDIVLVRVSGFSRADLDTAGLETRLDGRFRSLRIEDATLPEEPEAAGAAAAGRPTVESQFRRRLREQIDRCTDDPCRRRRLEEALRYGRLALRGRALRPPPAAAPEPAHAP